MFTHYLCSRINCVHTLTVFGNSVGRGRGRGGLPRRNHAFTVFTHSLCSHIHCIHSFTLARRQAPADDADGADAATSYRVRASFTH